MTDFLTGLWKSVEKGWQAGIASPLSGLSVGRGFFSDPFLSERDRDLQDVSTLYRRVRAAHERSIFADEETVDAAILEVLKNACRDSGVVNFEWATAIGHDTAHELLSREFLAFPILAQCDWQHLTLRSVSDLRAFLLRRDAQLRRANDVFDLACRTVCFLLTRIFEATGEEPASGDKGALTLNAVALDALHAPAEQIEVAWALFFNQELEDVGLFDDVRVQLRRNTLAACGTDESDPRIASKIVPPSKVRGREPRELVADYLSQTPLAQLFDAELPITVPAEGRFEHTHILGGSGHGKSQLLLHLIHHDLTHEDGPGLIVMDSQGDLVRTLSQLELFDPDGPLADRFVLIDPADVEYPIALSLFDIPQERMAGYTPAERERLLNGAVEMYEYVFSSLLGAELTQKQGVIFRFLARLMMVIPGATLHTFLDLMEHGECFREHMRQLDGTARRFFEEEFFHPSFSATKKQIAKRLWGILANPVFERMFSQPKGKLDFFEAMQDGKIILISTAKDLLRQEGAEIFGRFLLAKITQAVMERAAVPEAKRTPVFLYIDEAHEYVDAQMAQLLNQARKYRVGLTLAHQNLDQLPQAFRASVMASTSLKFAGGVSAKDARALADEMHVDPEFLQTMRKRRGRTEFACQIRNRTPRALAVSIPLGAVNVLPQLSDESFACLIERNREAFCVPMAAIESVINLPPEPARLPPPSALKPRSVDSYVEGKGGEEHKYLQHLLRGAAHERGFKAEIEASIEGGSVDVVIEAEGRRIACEVSIKTDAEHEARNVEKCVRAGFDQVWLIVPAGRRKTARSNAIQPLLRAETLALLSIYTPAEALAVLDALIAGGRKNVESIRGYTVSVRKAPMSPEEAKRRREAVASVLAKSLRRRTE